MPPKKPLSAEDRKALLAQAKGALANRTDPGHLAVAETPAAPSEPERAPEVAGLDTPPQPAGFSRETEHELFQQSRLPEPALNRLAKALIDNDASDEAFKRVIVEKLEQWEQTAPGDTAARETIYHQVRALRDWRAKLVVMAKASEKAEFREIRMRSMR